MEGVRIDKYLWAIRVFKTRTDATDACKGGKVKVGTVNAKPSRDVQVGEEISVRKGVATFTFKVLQLTDHRLGAKLVPDYMQDCTSPQQLELLELARMAGNGGRDRGMGRPTKKDRRDIEVFMSDNYLDEIDFDDEE